MAKNKEYLTRVLRIIEKGKERLQKYSNQKLEYANKIKDGKEFLTTKQIEELQKIIKNEKIFLEKAEKFTNNIKEKIEDEEFREILGIIGKSIEKQEEITEEQKKSIDNYNDENAKKLRQEFEKEEKLKIGIEYEIKKKIGEYNKNKIPIFKKILRKIKKPAITAAMILLILTNTVKAFTAESNNYNHVTSSNTTEIQKKSESGEEGKFEKIEKTRTFRSKKGSSFKVQIGKATINNESYKDLVNKYKDMYHDDNQILDNKKYTIIRVIDKSNNELKVEQYFDKKGIVKAIKTKKAVGYFLDKNDYVYMDLERKMVLKFEIKEGHTVYTWATPIYNAHNPNNMKYIYTSPESLKPHSKPINIEENKEGGSTITEYTLETNEETYNLNKVKINANGDIEYIDLGDTTFR